MKIILPKDYLILAGEHSPFSLFPSFGFKRKITRIFDVDYSLKAYVPIPEWSFGHNLFGVSLNKENSARFGWKYNLIEDVIEIYAITKDINDTRIYKFNSGLEIGRRYELTIYNSNKINYYIFSISNMEGDILEHIKIDKEKNSKRFYRFIKPKLHLHSKVKSDILISLSRIIKL